MTSQDQTNRRIQDINTGSIWTEEVSTPGRYTTPYTGGVQPKPNTLKQMKKEFVAAGWIPYVLVLVWLFGFAGVLTQLYKHIPLLGENPSPEALANAAPYTFTILCFSLAALTSIFFTYLMISKGNKGHSFAYRFVKFIIIIGTGELLSHLVSYLYFFFIQYVIGGVLGPGPIIRLLMPLFLCHTAHTINLIYFLNNVQTKGIHRCKWQATLILISTTGLYTSTGLAILQH
ncbi:hypothetical protein NEHOM01_1294 [Nematocida homosporus]|uniref:uncharacterized protein n=1 Tax=Nematocida homosporus TaxID=1912981 RepID=UPI0022208CD3|nr:uncharacterized protein NEHOM01_1294 [Nematocida homosporus]KAI5186129.1 hypothetical protein NEHOM01_1294 [Nematocida homosporus]